VDLVSAGLIRCWHLEVRHGGLWWTRIGYSVVAGSVKRPGQELCCHYRRGSRVGCKTPYLCRRHPCHYRFPSPDETSKYHRRLIRTGLGACIAYLVRVRGMATPTGGIGVASIVRDGDNARSVAVNVNIARSSSAPREVYLVSSLHFVATRSEGNLSWGWRRSRSNRSFRCRTWSGS
jgi:hypothetical protein